LEINYSSLILSILILLIFFVIYILIYKLLLEKNGGTLSFKKIYTLWFFSQFGKYIPGKVWVVMGKAYLFQKEGVSKKTAAITVTLEFGFSIIGGLIFALLSLPFWPKNQIIRSLYPLLCLIPIGLIAVYPSFFERVVNSLLGIFKRERIKLGLSYYEMLSFISIYTLIWIIFGIAFYFFINALYPIAVSSIPAITGMFSFSWSIGFLSFFAPAGIGVREGILTILLSICIPMEVAALVSISSRLWMTAVDLLSAGIGALFYFSGRKEKLN